jgi:cellulose synthase/poly-beta-1,6-N-acetylglucosamine synthase-like glycosyltransferase
MISILIPIYNFDVREVIKELHRQLEEEKVDYEILLIDDASEEKFKVVNSELQQLSNVKYSEEKYNIGRSKIRNKLAEVSKYNNLLFIDCDSGIPYGNYIKNYLSVLAKYPIVYGGRLYDKSSRINEINKLHWLYGVKREQIPVKERSQEPNKSFQSNNFLVSKTLLQSIGFNEQIIGYGHEDTLFGYELQKMKIDIVHIDNPVVHLGLETNEEFLRKTQEGIKNLIRIMRINGNEKRLVKDVTILSVYKKIEKIGLVYVFEYLYKQYEHILRRNLLSRHPKLIVFDLYKLGYLCTISDRV